MVVITVKMNVLTFIYVVLIVIAAMRFASK
jgi:hypothetical protein